MGKKRTAISAVLFFYWRCGKFLSVDKEGCHSAGFTTTARFHGQHLLYDGMALKVFNTRLFFHSYLDVSIALPCFSGKCWSLNGEDFAKPGVQ